MKVSEITSVRSQSINRRQWSLIAAVVFLFVTATSVEAGRRDQQITVEYDALCNVTVKSTRAIRSIELGDETTITSERGARLGREYSLGNYEDYAGETILVMGFHGANDSESIEIYNEACEVMVVDCPCMAPGAAWANYFDTVPAHARRLDPSELFTDSAGIHPLPTSRQLDILLLASDDASTSVTFDSLDGSATSFSLTVQRGQCGAATDQNIQWVTTPTSPITTTDLEQCRAEVEALLSVPD